MMSAYKETAKNIVKEAIKSVIYIDENALEPFDRMDGNESEEEKRSMVLYESFKKEAITLSVLKYTPEQYTNSFKYTFQNRDLILLDWELEGTGRGGERALEILSEIVCNQHHIHFCALYTAEEDKDGVMKNIISYFSNTTKSEYDDFKLELESYQNVVDAVPSFNHLILHREKDKIERVFQIGIKDAIHRIHETINAEDNLCSMIKCAIAFDDKTYKSSIKLPCPQSFNPTTHTLIIENTIIQILNKQETKPENLIDSFSENIADYPWGVMQLLGLEMQNITRRKSSFITSDVLRVSINALAYHKKKHKEDFQSFIKDVLIEQSASILRNETLSLVDSIEAEEKCNSNTELVAMNVFYNSTCFNCNKKLSFGDVFKSGNDYYICITALCDCALPEIKINNSFFFAKGSYIKPSTALKSAETGFVSFLDKNNAVKWDSDNTSDGKVPYIKPICFTIPNNTIVDGKIIGYLLDKEGNRKELDFQYVTTIKQNYTQRIANHTFAYPVRVGVDFVKIAENN